ncbi:uncharacterized protein LOC6598949 [Drosophila persimilis]|uniref:uncharacterized protein LOC6598949 n=1 Tax=Drosophila persimilis TaxID=7234 RepID=UPI000F07E7BA|nr:uncharacterized protein LOC6598949 [Drosophila persimilis]
MNDPGLGPPPKMADPNHASPSSKVLSLPTPPSQSPAVGSATLPKRIIKRIPLDFNKLQQSGLDIKLAEALRKQTTSAMPTSIPFSAPATATAASAVAATSTAQSTGAKPTAVAAVAAASIEQKQKSAPPAKKRRSNISNYIEKVIPEQIVAERTQHVKTLIKNRILNKGKSTITTTTTLNHPKTSTGTMTAPKASPSSALGSGMSSSVFVSPIAKANVTARSKQPPLLLNLVNQLPKHRAMCVPSMQQLSRQQEPQEPQPQPQPQPQWQAPLIHKAPSPPLIVLENKVLTPEEKIDLSDLRLPSAAAQGRPQGRPVPEMARRVQAYPSPSSSKAAKTKVILSANKLKVSREKLAEMAKEIHNQVKQVEKPPAPDKVSPRKAPETPDEVSPILVSLSPSPSPLSVPSPSHSPAPAPAPKLLSAVDFITQLAAENPMGEGSFTELSLEEQVLNALFDSRGCSRRPSVEEKPPESPVQKSQDTREPEEELPIGKILKLEEMDILHATLDVNEDRESVLRFSPNAIKLQNSAVARRDPPEANMRLILKQPNLVQPSLAPSNVSKDGPAMAVETNKEMSQDAAGMAEKTASQLAKDEAGMTEKTVREMSKDVAGMAGKTAREMSKDAAEMAGKTAREMSKDVSGMAEKTAREMSKDVAGKAEKTAREMSKDEAGISATEASSVPQLQSSPAPEAAASKEKEDKPPPPPAKRVPRFKKGKVNLVQRSKRANLPKPKEALPDKEVEKEEEEPTIDQSLLEDRREVEVIKQADDSITAKEKVNLHLSIAKSNLQAHADDGEGESVAREANKEEQSKKSDPEEILVIKGPVELEAQEDSPPKPSTERDLNQLYHPPKMPKNKEQRTSKPNNNEDQPEPAATSSSNVSLLLDVLNQEPPAAQGEALLPFRKQSQSQSLSETPSQSSESTGIQNLVSHLSAEKIMPQIKRVSPNPTPTSNQPVPRKKLVKTRPVLNKRPPRFGSMGSGHPISVSGEVGGAGAAAGRIATSSTSDDDGSVFLGFDNKEESQTVEDAVLQHVKQMPFNETDISDDATPDYDETEEEQQETHKKSSNEGTKDLSEAEASDSRSNASPMQFETLPSTDVVETCKEDAPKCEAAPEMCTKQDMNVPPDPQIQSDAITPANEGSSETPIIEESPEITAFAEGSKSEKEQDSSESKTNQMEPDLQETTTIEDEPPSVEAKGKLKPRGRPKKATTSSPAMATTKANCTERPENSTSDVTNEAATSSSAKRKRTSRSHSPQSVEPNDAAEPPQSVADGTPSVSSNRKRQSRLSSPTATPKVPAKRGRKSLAAVAEAARTTTPTPETRGKLQEEEKEKAVEATPARKRGRPKQATKLDSEEQDVASNGEATPNTKDAFPMRLLLIRKREQLGTNEELHQEGQGKGPLQCGLCLFRTTKAQWLTHLRQHYGVGWVLTGEEPQQRTLSRQDVLKMMKGHLKDGHSTYLVCRLCDRQLGSGLGMLTHLEACGDKDRPQCQYCKRSYTKLYLRSHEPSCRQRPNAQQQQENEDRPDAEAEADTTAAVASESKPKSDSPSPFCNADWIKRLMLIRKREQLDSNEELHEKGEEKGPLQCGLCLAHTTKDQWHTHLRKHYGVGWQTGKEPQTLTRQSVLGMMIAFLKQGHAKHLECRMCGRQLGSGLGMLMHLETCGSNDRLECQHCKRSYTRLYHPAHEKTCRKRPGIQQKDEPAAAAAAEATGPVYTNAGYAKRKSTIRAEKKLKKIEAELKTQETNDNPKGDFEGDSSDYDMNKDKESSEEYDTEAVDSNEDAAQTEDDVSASDTRKSKLIKRTKRTKTDGGNSMRSNKLTGGTNCQPLFSRYAKLKEKVEQKWNQFTDKNYAAEALYPQLTPGYVKLSPEEASKLLPAKDNRSMRYAYGNAATADDWRQLEPLESFQTADEHIGYLGAPVKQLAWAPLPPTVAEQYLLCSLRKEMLKHAKHKPEAPEDDVLMLLKCQLSESEERRGVWPLATRLHYAIRVPSGPVHSFAFMPSGGYDKSANRLGLLAVASTQSDVNIYSLPLNLEDEAKGHVVIELQPSLTLTLDVNNPVTDLCTKICWSEASGHNFLATGYFRGNVAFWDISDEEGINCFKRNGHIHFVPLHYFYFGEHNIQTVELHYDTNGPRWLAIGSSTRKLWIYDIINWTQPLPLNEDSIANLYLANVSWPPIWETLVVGCSDVQRRFYSRLITLSPTGILFNNKTVDYTVSSARAMHFNVRENVLVVGTDNGDLVFLNTRELNAEPILLKMTSKCRAVSSSNLCNLNTESTPAPDKPITTEDFLQDFGLNVKPLAGVGKSQKNAYIDPKRLPKPYELLAMTRLNTVRCNWNSPARSWVAVGAEHGLLRIVHFDRDKFF